MNLSPYWVGWILYKKEYLGHGMLGFSFPCSIGLSGWGLRRKLRARVMIQLRFKS